MTAKKKLNITILCAGLIAAITVTSVSVFATGTGEFQLPSCPLTAQSNRTIVSFVSPQKVLLSSGTEEQAKSGPYSAVLTSGDYRVTLVSYDDHTGHGGQAQPQESYYLILRNSQGAPVVNTASISDLPELDDIRTEVVNSQLNISSDIASMVAFHAAYPSQASPNSIYPVCAAFDRYTADFSVDKQVRNITSGGDFANDINAQPGNALEFRMEITNTSSIIINNLKVKDNLPSKLEYQASSIKVDGQNVALEDFFGSNGITIASLGAGQKISITFRVQVNSADNFSTGTTDLTNTAIAFLGSVSKDDSAVVHVTITQTRDLSLQKRVLNLTRGESNFSDSVNANPGDRVKFEIRFETTGNASQNSVYLRDSLPSDLSFQAGTLRINNSSFSSDENLFSGNGRNFGMLSSGSVNTVTFEALVNSSASGNPALTNYVYVRSSEVSEKQASARVYVSGGGGDRGLIVTKRVMNLTRSGSSYQDSVIANPGDRIKFEIRYEITGNGTQNNIIIRDILPDKILRFSGTLQENSGSVSSSYESEYFGSGRSLGTITGYASRVLTFEATVAGSGAFSGTQTLTNYANIRSDQVSTQQDTADINVQFSTSTQFTKRKTAYNLTQRVDATTTAANSGDVISYTLFYGNTGQGTISGVVIEDDIRDILELARLTNQGGALSVDNSVIGFAAVDVPAGVEISRTFEVIVRPVSEFPANSDLIMTNIYGNEIRVPVRKPTVGGEITPPRTGAGEWIAGILATLSTLGFFIVNKRRIKFSLK